MRWRHGQDLFKPIEPLCSRAEVTSLVGQGAVICDEEHAGAVSRRRVANDVEQRFVGRERAGVMYLETAPNPLTAVRATGRVSVEHHHRRERGGQHARKSGEQESD
jgi:hypothetical protein